MFKCPKCNAEFAENKNFCEFCGAQLEAVEAPAAEAPVAETPVAETPVADAYYAPVEEPVKAKKSFNVKKLLAIGIPVVAVIIVAAILLSIFGIFKKSGPSYILFSKDGEIWFSKTSKIAPREISKNEGDSPIKVSNDGKYIFFYDDTEDGDNLYYVKANDKKAQPTKIDKDVYSYKISADGKTVTYINEDGKLYQHNLKERGDKIADDVTSFYVSRDGKKIYYVVTKDNDSTLYIKNGKKEAVKISSEVSTVRFSEDFDTVYFIKGKDNDKSLMKAEGTKGKAEKISDDVLSDGIIKIYESGDLYFETTVEKEEENEYGDKEKVEEKTLCFYNGKEVKTIAEDYKGWKDYALDSAAIVYYVKEGEGEDAQTKYYIAVEDVKNEIKTEKDYTYSFAITDDAKTLYYLSYEYPKYEDYKNDSKAYNEAVKNVSGEVFEVAISGKKLKEAKDYDKDVSPYAGFSVQDDKLVYAKDYDDEKGCGTYYIAKEKVGEDVYEVVYVEPMDKFMALTDYDKKDNTVTLNIVKGKKLEKIDSEVYEDAGFITPDGDFLYLKDYEDGEGTLYMYSGGKPKKVSEDVEGIYSYDYYEKDEYYK